jgi:hypothetical protein
MNKFISSGNNSDLNMTLGHYSRTATGGAEIAARRLGNVTKTGAILFGLLNGESTENNIDLNKLIGLPCDQAISIISSNISSSVYGDSEIIKKAMSEALSEALSGIDVFDPKAITDDILLGTMINFLANSIFLRIVMDSSEMWTEAEGTSDIVRAETKIYRKYS